MGRVVDLRAAACASGCAVALAALAADDGGYFPRSWGWAGALAAAIGLAAIARGARGPAARLELAFAAGLAAAGLLALLTTAWSLDAPSSVAEAQRTLALAAGVLAALAILRRGDGGALAAGVLGAATGVSLANLASRAGGGAGGDTGSAAAPVGYDNALGLLATLGVLLALAFLRAPLPWHGAALATLPVNGVVLFLTGSTGALGALGTGLAAAALAAGGRLRTAGAAGLVAIGVAAAATAGGHERGRYWSVALDAAAEEPLGGTGAGTFWQLWLRDREVPLGARDAHGLYVETLAEQGVAGLALLLAVLAVPLLAAARGPRRPLVLGAYAAFLAHSALDWDWELAGVALAGLLLGCALLLDARPPGDWRLPRTALAAAAAGLLLACLWTLTGALALERARDSLREGRDGEAASRARLGARIEPWAVEPWLVATRAERTRGRPERARAAALEGLDRAPNDWRLWLELAGVSQGEERERALARARSLNPLGPIPPG